MLAAGTDGAAATEHELHGPPPAAALEAWAAACGPRPLPAETVAVEDALGRVSADAVWARRSSPAFPAAAMDGIAVASGATAAAAEGRPVRLEAGAYDVVDTGDPLPAGRDAVIQRERVVMDGETAVIDAPAGPGRHVRAVGEDVAAGELVIAPGRRLGALDLALAAAAGHGTLTVRRAPVVAILPTGDELRPATADLAPGELADTNSIMLEAQACEAGCRTVRGEILPDDPDRLAEAIRDAAAQADLVLVIAGTSAGRGDHAPEVLRRLGRIVVRGVAMRPGHPAVLAVVGGTPVMGCPGYPVSAALAFEDLALPLLARMSGAPAEQRARVPAALAAEIGSKGGAQERLRVALGAVEGRRVAVPLRRGASVLSALARADGLVTAAADQTSLPAGAPVRVDVLRPPGAGRTPLLVAGPPDHAVDLLLLACAEEGLAPAFCEMGAEDALALVAEGRCHAAVAAGERRGPAVTDGARLATIALAEQAVALVVAPGNPLGLASPADLARPGLRIVAGPAARRLAPDVAAGAVRSDAAAVAAVAGGHADCAIAGVPAARAAGLDALPFARTRFDLTHLRGADARDDALEALRAALARPDLAAALAAAGYEAGGDVSRAA
jgi:putative molybdopterin biosynthesis protein